MPTRIQRVAFWVLLLPFAAGCEFKKFDRKRAEPNHLRMIGLTAETYKQAFGEYPTSIDSKEFVEILGGETINDQWGTPVKYETAKDSYSVTSAGPDKEHGTADDIRLTSQQVET